MTQRWPRFPNDKQLTLKELCDHLCVHRTTVYRWRKNGKLHIHKYINRKSYVFLWKDVKKVLGSDDGCIRLDYGFALSRCVIIIYGFLKIVG
ncbi:helix-turn-helix transcriptional regulator [Xanthobacter sediminis]|uniref:helix-turn-helix transcriptional regulator n=1 Tax=Xanthobacter sediminis TaxID=3119926 RepID=UPI00372D7828